MKQSMPRSLWLLFGPLIFLAVVEAIEIDNALLGEPEVECGSTAVEMQFRTKNPFRGKVFVKGHYNNQECRVDYSQTSTDRPVGGITLHHGACDMNRQRMINPQGMQFSAVVVVSFHATFITKIDRAFHIKCMYRELSKSVSSNIHVSALATTQLSHTFPMPVCTYTIRKDEIDGEVLRYARVGEQVVHRWECQTGSYGILVHSCVVEDGQGQKIQIVDEKGCHVDQYLLGDPTYVEALNMAYRESHVFKFADRVAVRFQCQIRLCMKDDGGCQGITPPACDEGDQILTNERLTVNETEPRRRRRRSEAKFEPIDGDFVSQYIYVLDSTENPEKPSSSTSDSDRSALRKFLMRANGAIVSEVQNSVCLSSATFGILLGSLSLVFVTVAFIVSLMCCNKLRANAKTDSDSRSCYNSVVTLWNQ